MLLKSSTSHPGGVELQLSWEGDWTVVQYAAGDFADFPRTVVGACFQLGSVDDPFYVFGCSGGARKLDGVMFARNLGDRTLQDSWTCGRGARQLLLPSLFRSLSYLAYWRKTVPSQVAPAIPIERPVTEAASSLITKLLATNLTAFYYIPPTCG